MKKKYLRKLEGTKKADRSLPFKYLI
jgi:hypothetical protein